MKTCRAIAIASAFLSATICAYQTVARESSAEERTQANEEAVSLPSGAAVFAELDSTLDSKKVKGGDGVVAHTIREIKYNGKVILPRNTKLAGHVTQASARSKGDPDSTLAIQFDKALPKKGPEMPLKVVLRAVAAPERNTPSAGPEQTSVNVGTQTSPMGSARSPMPGSSPTQTAPGGPARSGSEDGDGTVSLSESSHGVIGIGGLQLTPTDSANVEKGALLVSAGKSVHLDGGTRLLFSVQ